MAKGGTVRIPSLTRHVTGRARLRIGGLELYLGPYGSPESKQRYERTVQQWLSAGSPNPWIGPATALGGRATGSMKLAELMVRYIDFARQHYRKDGEETSEVNAIQSALSFVRTLYGFETVESFGPLALKNCQDFMARSDLCRNVVNQYVGRIRRMFKWAVANELVGPGVDHALTRVPGLSRGRSQARETRRVEPVPRSDIRRIMRHVSRQVRAMIWLQRLTGMRPGEVATMRAIDLEFGPGLWTYRPSSHKTQHLDRPRTVELGRRCQRLIKPFLRPDTHSRLFRPAQAEAERAAELRKHRKTPLYPSHLRRLEEQRARCPRVYRDGYDGDSYRRAIARACDAEGVQRWHPHQLRHNFATRIRRKHGIEMARAVLGHASAFTTEIYAETDQAKVRELMKQCG